MAFPSRPWLEPSFELTAHLPEEQRIQISQHRSVKLIALAQLYEHNYITLFGCVNHLLLHSNSGFYLFEQISRFIVSFPYIFFQSPPAINELYQGWAFLIMRSPACQPQRDFDFPSHSHSLRAQRGMMMMARAMWIPNPKLLASVRVTPRQWQPGFAFCGFIFHL